MSKPSPGLDTEPVPDTTQHVPDLPTFGRFQVIAELGAGAMGTVYRANDAVLGRAIAIKALHAANQIGVRERFVREARAIGAVHHPNILAIYDAGTEGDTPYLVMELAPAGTLRDRIAAGPLAVDTVRKIGIQIARALAAAHTANILHRDVKPANILCAHDGTWKLADFGIARLPDSSLTITGQFLGSPSYAAPESLRAGQFSPASDVYGLGATLYEALTGAPPYGRHDMASLIRKLEHEAPLRPAGNTVPGALSDAIMTALEHNPARRPSVEQLANQLACADDDTPRPVPRSARPTRRRTLLVASIVAIALVTTLLATRDRSPSTTRGPAPGMDGLAAPADGESTEPSASQDDREPGV
ncbi:MAG TPA: serine/threonine-protein kinase, partial [Kofleriaceae bacterium]|nr:serine/threonine-protein kinase [Kofleriaceae bacterium]